ncbi:Hypothetical predicted protein [Paramuricea clavata]|uniref:Uncharacterized protein n=1 Tax=Paramuricea clavata TaxID=317549 RepID=A0A7D9LRT5_PARCT|nr:Hypothetical predicted protein [Paramuricea clavata]
MPSAKEYFNFEATRTFLLRDTITRLNYFFSNTLMEQCGDVKGASMVIRIPVRKKKVNENQLPSFHHISQLLEREEPVENIDLELISSSDEGSSSDSDTDNEL